MAQTVSLTTSNKGQDLTFRFSEIATVLQGRLTDTEINDILVGLLSQSIMDVKPGDLITAEWAMSVVRRIERLELSPNQTSAYATKMLACLRDTISFYEGLIIKSSFIPSDVTDTPIKAIMQINAMLQRVVTISLSGIAIVFNAEAQQLLSIFKFLYDAQSDIASLLSSQLLGSSESSSRNSFAALLKFQLDSDQGSLVSLKTALNQGNLDLAIQAQNRINGIVMNYTGDVTIGGIQITYIGSNGAGRVLKLNDTNPIQYSFQVFNKTNKTLDINVKAAFRKPRESWSSSLRIVGSNGFTSITPFDSSTPNDPKAFRIIEVLVITPPGAAINETGILDLIVDVPAPISITNSASIDISIGAERIPEGSSWVRFINEPFLTSDSENPTNELQKTSYIFGYQFHGIDNTVTRKFKVKIDVTSPGTDQLFEFDISRANSGGLAPVLEPPGSTKRTQYVSNEFDVVSDELRSFIVDVWPQPTSSGRTLTYTVNIISIDGALQTDTAKTISISVN